MIIAYNYVIKLIRKDYSVKNCKYVFKYYFVLLF